MKKKLEVKGMTCGSCVKKVTKIVSGFEGVSDVTVDLQRMEATFEYDPRTIDTGKVVEAINDYGYTAREKE